MAISEWYDHTTFPATRASLSSSAMRSELAAIQNGISAKLPDLSGNGGKLVAVNAGATALEAITTTGTGNGVRATSPTITTPVLTGNVEVRNGANATIVYPHNTYTDSSNYERLRVGYASNIAYVLSESLGTGTNRELKVGTEGAANLTLRAGGTDRWRVDSSTGAFIGRFDNVVDIGAAGATRPRSIYAATSITTAGTGGIGYATGAGGTVTQATSKSTGVTLEKTCGQITMHNAALASGAKVSFVVTNALVAETDLVIPSVVSGGTANAYRASVTAIAAGSFTITVENITAGSLSEAPVIGFAVVKGVTS
jgi:hypothetical protein